MGMMSEGWVMGMRVTLLRLTPSADYVLAQWGKKSLSLSLSLSLPTSSISISIGIICVYCLLS